MSHPGLAEFTAYNVTIRNCSSKNSTIVSGTPKLNISSSVFQNNTCSRGCFLYFTTLTAQQYPGVTQLNFPNTIVQYNHATIAGGAVFVQEPFPEIKFGFLDHWTHNKADLYGYNLAGSGHHLKTQAGDRHVFLTEMFHLDVSLTDRWGGTIHLTEEQYVILRKFSVFLISARVFLLTWVRPI